MLKQGWTMIRNLIFRIIKVTSLILTFLTFSLASLCVLAPSISAEEYDQIIVLSKMTSVKEGGKTQAITDALPIALSMALTEIGITPIDPRFAGTTYFEVAQTSPEMIKALQRYDAERTGRLLILEVSVTPEMANPELMTPIVSIIDVKSGLVPAIVTTLPVLVPLDHAGINAAATALARSVAMRMDENGYLIKPSKIKPWGGVARKVRLALEGFNGCEQQVLLTIMEEEFPGFLGMELVKAPNPDYSIYNYHTTATKQRLNKWVRLLMAENRASISSSTSDKVRLYAQKEGLRLQKIKNTVIFRAECGG